MDLWTFIKQWQARFPFQFILSLSIGGLLFAYISEKMYRFSPCVLCEWQRYGLMLICVLAVLGMLVRPKLYMTLIVLTFGINTGISGYQVLLEKGYVEVPKVCALKPSKTLEEYQENLKKHRPCDRAQGFLLGLSYAFYAMMYYCVLFFYTIFHIVQMRKKHE